LDEYFNQSLTKILKFKIHLPLLITGKYIRLEVSQNELYLKNAKIYELVLKLPLRVNPENVKAVFDNESRILTVELIVKYGVI
jgi:hypothetical protein